MKDKRKQIAKVIVPVIIVAVIVGMWFVKNGLRTENVPSGKEQSEQNTDIPETAKEADFSLKVTEQIDFEALSEHGFPVIADYGSDDCIPCKEMKPVLKKMNEEFAGKAFVKFVDVWKDQNAAKNVPIQIIPTQVLFNADGTPFVLSDELHKEMEFLMYNDKEEGKHTFTVHQGGLPLVS